MRKLMAIVLLLAASATLGAQMPWPRPLLPARTTAFKAGDVSAWGLQLQNVLPLAIPPAVDVIVVDYARETANGRGWTPERVDALRHRDGAKDRIVLSYLSIGEAESYRHYWRPSWLAKPPAWLGAENTAWKGNYAVRYWHPSWQRRIVAPKPTVLSRLAQWLAPDRTPFIDHILDAGFDGVYLDRVDAFDDWDKERGETAARSDMAAFVRTIADYARSRRPGFLIVPQNGEELLELPGYVDGIDAVAKEDLLYGAGTDGVANDADTVTVSTELLDRARSAGKPVLVVEYLANGDQRRAAAASAIAKRGYVPLFATRALDQTPESPARTSAASRIAPVAPR